MKSGKCYRGREISTEDGYTCPNDATHYLVDVNSGLVLELCEECACWIKLYRESVFGKNMGAGLGVLIEPMENLK